MEYQTPVEHINKVCDYLQTKGNILKRSGPYVRELDAETDEDETTYNTEFDPEKVAALKEHFQEQANQLTSPQYILTLIHRGRIFSCLTLDVTNALNALSSAALWTKFTDSNSVHTTKNTHSQHPCAAPNNWCALSSQSSRSERSIEDQLAIEWIGVVFGTRSAVKRRFKTDDAFGAFKTKNP